MTGVTHGADPDKLDQIGRQLHVQAERVAQVNARLGAATSTLQGSWGGPDAQSLLEQAADLRPSLDRAGVLLVAFAGQLQRQADQQREASGEGGAAAFAGAHASGRAHGERKSFVDRWKDRAQKWIDDRGAWAPIDGGPGSGGKLPYGMDGSMLANESRVMEPSHDGGSTPPPSVIEDGTENGGKTVPAGSVGHSDETKGPVKGRYTDVVSVSDEFVDAQGRSVQTYTVSMSAEMALQAEADGKLASGSVGIADGEEATFSVTLPVGSEVDPATINPLDPASWPPGTSVRMTSSQYADVSVSGSVLPLVADAGITNGEGSYVEISRGEGSQVTVQVGDEEFLRERANVGVGLKDHNVKVGGSSETSVGHAKEYTFDVSTSEGKAAFENYTWGGKVPPADAPGVVDVANATIYNSSSSVGGSLTFGNFSVDGVVGETANGAVVREYADGTSSVEWSGKQGEVQVGGTVNYDASGNPIVEDSTYTFQVEGVDPNSANLYNDAARGGNAEPVTAEQNVTVTYTSDDLQTMRHQAATVAADKINKYPEDYPDFDTSGGPVTADEVLAHVEGNPDGVADVTGMDTSRTTESLLRAQDDDDVVRTLMKDPIQTNTDVGADYYEAVGGRATPVGEVESHPSAT